MPWDEFSDLLSGIGPDTALGRIVAIRAEEDEEILKHFTPEQRRIRREWRNKQAMKVSEEDRDKFLEVMKQAFIDMAQGKMPLLRTRTEDTVHPGCQMPGRFHPVPRAPL